MTDEPLWVLESCEREKIRARLARDADCGEVLCREVTERAERCVSALRERVALRTQAVFHALQALGATIEGFIPATRSCDRDAREETTPFLTLCAFLMLVEERRSQAEEALLSCLDVWELGQECNACLLKARGTVLTVRAQTDARADRYVSELERVEALYGRLSRSFSDFHARVSEVLASVLPVFLEKMQECADFSGKGERCDLRTADTLCNALWVALKNVSAPQID